METIAFIGLGNLGLPMATNLVKAGHRVLAYDVVQKNLDSAVQAGAQGAADAAEASSVADVIITMVPSGKEVRQVFLQAGVANKAKPGSLFIDCSTTDVESARVVKQAARDAGHEMIDAPVSGGYGRAVAGTLTIMVGGTEGSFRRAEPILSRMASSVQYLGGDGTGLVAKICNNMIAGATLVAVSEAFVLAKRLGLDGQKLFDVASRSSGQCWALTTMCPIPGPVPSSPANNGYKPGGAATMLMKDLGMAQEAAVRVGVPIPMSATALSLYTIFCNSGRGHLDVSAIIQLLEDVPVGDASS
jgi:3-hydroxyisobutyrate dehydrogenase